MQNNHTISVLLPTRKRVPAMQKSLESLLVTADRPDQIEFLIGVDRDDDETLGWFQDQDVEMFDQYHSGYTAWLFDRLGYDRLNEYVNVLSRKAQGKWLLMWNDDAIMDTKGWDTVISDYKDTFAVLRAETNHLHPYAIFPIIPRKWVELTGTFSPHQLNDAWVSQVGYMLDIVVDIPVHITHDRFDLTGNNGDDIYRERVMYEGNPSQPHDFNHLSWRERRMQQSITIANYLKSQGVALERWEKVLRNEVDVWEKMLAKDVKKQMMSYPVKASAAAPI